MIHKRGDSAPWMPNKWSLVGGVLEKNEDSLSGVIREAFEEIGLYPINVIFTEHLETTDIGHIHYFIGELDSDKVILDYENKDYPFINKDDIDDYDCVPYIKDYLKSLSKFTFWDPR